MDIQFATRVQGVPRSFIREILKVSLDPEIISFAGGLPNPAFFPVDEIRQATETVFTDCGPSILQYSNSEGDIGLRKWIAERYLEKSGLVVDPENIIITNGSQQGLDLLAKVLLDKGDGVIIEEPGYLGAIQSLSLYEPRFVPVPLTLEGLNTTVLREVSREPGIKMAYMVPNFQNPTGITYTDQNREEIVAIAKERKFVLIEDNPYGELRFAGKKAQSLASILPEQTVLLGSFSKIVAPGFRLGWIVSPPWLNEKIIIAKQAADLHTTSFNQKIICTYLQSNDLDKHIGRITKVYGEQCRAMGEALREHFPPEVTFTNPEGGMFMWGWLPEHMDSMELFQASVKEKVVFVPGVAFYTTNRRQANFRLNFSCADPDTIKEGVRRMARALASIS